MSPESPIEDHLRNEPAREVDDSKANIQASGEKATRVPRRPRIPVLSLAAALVFFFGPAIAFTLGDRAAPIENRPLAGMPSLDSGWQVIPGFNAWAIDHLPLRSQAVRADTNLSEAVFGEPPPSAAARVIQGKDDWLYLADDFSFACDPRLSLPAVIDGLKR